MISWLDDRIWQAFHHWEMMKELKTTVYQRCLEAERLYRDLLPLYEEVYRERHISEPPKGEGE
jgi:hypothetical protein